MSRNRETRVAEVLVDLHIEKPLDYLIPEELMDKVSVGSRVEIPLRGKNILGIVSRIKNETAFATTKPLIRVSEEAGVTKELFELALWMSGYYLTPLKKILKILIPSSVRNEKSGKMQFMVFRAKPLQDTADAARDLREKGSRQADVLDCMLKASKGMLLSELLEKSAVSRSSVDSLVKKNFLSIERVQIGRSPLKDAEYFKTKAKTLNDEQAVALKNITASLDEEAFKVHLLWGITGSGKTEVYLQAIDHALKAGKGAIMLVPEIALTEQTIERFQSRFEGQIAILHHRLSDGERLDEWHKIRKGEAQIVIGARSCIFSPLPNLGLIILDEEHEGSYKQSDESPRYHAREVAIMRAKLTHSTVILGSATPCLETFHNAQTGKYHLSELKGRADSQRLPTVKIIDMKMEYEKNGGYTLFSQPLLDGIKERLKLGEQTILFLNKRGYHACLKCLGCGEAIKCRHCDVTLTFHKSEKQLACHLCGYHLSPPQECPTCKAGSVMKFKGVGTEQAEAALKAIFPEVRTLRMDADTTKHKGSHSRLFRDFGRGKADVLIGTQMIAKGLHFPEVTLVGVLSCDTSLNIPDFRSSEIAFQLLTQVAGRAGRGVRPGEVILQTMMPDNGTILLASKQDFPAFYKEEIASRQLFSYPPYAHLIKIGATSTSEKAAFDLLESIRKKLSPHLPPDYEIHPTLPAGHAKVKDLFRFHFLIKGPKILPLIKTLGPILPHFESHKTVKLSVDVGPLSTFF